MSNIIDSIQISGVTYTISGQSSGANAVEVTQAEYDALVTGGTVDPNAFYIITDAQVGDLTNYYTKTEVDNAITAATSTKQDTLVSSQNIKTINNESILGSGNIDIQGGGGGGKAIEAGRGISITTGETADTVSFSLPISANTNNSVVMGGKITNSFTNNGRDCLMVGSQLTTNNGSDCCLVVGYRSSVNGDGSAVIGWNSKSVGDSSFAFGTNVTATTSNSFAIGYFTITNNDYEHTSGKYNVSNTGSTTADKTLFSVGNGTADNARHNAFEIRQNGDIYLSSGGTDIKLQDHLGGGGGSITIDPTLNTGSTNAVANSAITTAINAKQDSSKLPTYIVNGWNYDKSTHKVSVEKTLKSNGGVMNVSNSVITINNQDIFNNTNVSNLNLVETSAITTSVTSSSTDAQVPSAKAVNDKLGGLSLVKLTQSEYDALSPNYDSNTLYVIVN